MPELSAPHWNEKTGVCTKHFLPMLPCPVCATEKNRDLEVQFNETDFDVARSEGILLRDLLPGNFVYLAEETNESDRDLSEFLGELTFFEMKDENNREATESFRARYGFERFNQ